MASINNTVISSQQTKYQTESIPFGIKLKQKAHLETFL